MPPRPRPWLALHDALRAGGAPAEPLRRWVVAAATRPVGPPDDPRWAALAAETGLALFDPAGWAPLTGWDPGNLPPADPDPADLCARLAGDRRRQGAWYTPPALVDWLVAGLDRGEVCDLACGAGDFLLGVLRATPPARRRERLAALWGTDPDAVAVDLAVARLVAAAGGDVADARALAARVRVGDVFVDPPPDARFDAVVGNPPFRSRLRRRTDLDAATAARLRARHGEAAGPYTDAATFFLLEADRAARPEGLVAQVLPVSVYANRDAAPARARLAARRPPEAAWTLPNGAFPGVSVAVVATRFRRGATRVERAVGVDGRPLPPTPLPDGSWSPLLGVDGAPAVHLPRGRTLGELAEVTADFRDEYYALRGAITETGDGPKLVTVGLVDLARLAWGERPAKLHGVRWLRPRLDLARFPATPQDARWLDRRRVPKLLVATQTRVVEAVLDADADLLGTTPVITVTSARAPLPELLAALVSPVATAWLRARAAGTGLTLDVLRLSAAGLRALPLPPEGPELRAAAAVVLALHCPDPTHRPALLRELGERTLAAYGADRSLLDPWLASVRGDHLGP